MSSRRVAAIDCGTNSIRLLIAELNPVSGSLTDVDRRMEIVRLGEGVDRTGRLSSEALARTFVACDQYAAAIRDRPVESVRFVATSASRDASNRGEFEAGVLTRLGVMPEVISGNEEAALSFRGATRELVQPFADETGVGSEALARRGPYLVVDIGGGSTEFVLGTAVPDASVSVDIGCVRMTERHLRDDPPTDSQIAAATADIDVAIASAGRVVSFATPSTLVGLAGSVTTVAALSLGLGAYDSSKIHRSVISADEVRRVSDELLGMTRAQRAALPVMHPGRVDVIGAGALVLRRIVEATGAREVLVSEHDILDGIAWSQVERG